MMKFLLIEDDPEIVEYISIAFELVAKYKINNMSPGE
jgi:hypothetical protein